MRRFETFLIEKRGYVSQMPESNSVVVLIMSGGLDSTIAAAMLMENHNLMIFPLFVKRGQRARIREESSLDYFSKIFKRRYPKLFNEPMKVELPIPPEPIKRNIPKERVNALGHPMRDSTLLSVGVQYAVAIENKYGIKTRRVFNASHLGCGCADFPHARLLALRSQTINTCINMGDWNWQITSPLLDSYLGKPKLKSDLVQWGVDYEIEVEKTWSCYEGREMHCGICLACDLRQRAFKDVGIEDKTGYIV